MDTCPMPEIDQYLKDFPSFLKVASRSADAMSTRWPFGSNTVDKTISMAQKFASDMNANSGLVDDTQQVQTAPEPISFKEVSYVSEALNFNMTIQSIVQAGKLDEAPEFD